jgi:hypothetical protein
MASTTAVQGLRKASNLNDRVAACFYSGSQFSLNLNMTDGLTHRVALYLVDWDIYGGGRTETIEVLDQATGAVLSTQSASAFSGGTYLIWELKGNVQLRFTNTNSAANAVLSGFFFSAPQASQAAPPPPASAALGTKCSSPGTCSSGYCSGGVCCDVACTDACATCTRGDSVGTCQPAAAGTVCDPWSGWRCSGTSTNCAGAALNAGEVLYSPTVVCK